ncbi:hypothetical protein [Shewanella xiamenensis]|uniref:hypothetical protein n=1 Tax=Shewanella xiamenensis TaxID=332186 RepID=UPI002E7C2A6F|nr:hypothetical protein [Shewanella xiamenensis]MEE1981509.1 hypothetical protein [Shewanella xiamenensis]
MTYLILILLLIIFLLAFVVITPKFRLLKRPTNLLASGFIKAKIDLAIRVFAHSFSVSFPLMVFDFLSVSEAIIYNSVFILLALLIKPDVRINENADLMMTKGIIKNVVSIHLVNPYQNFTKKTYSELLKIVETLPHHGIKTIYLSSPMFYLSDGTLRDFSLLEKLLMKKGATITSYEAKQYSFLLQKINLLIRSNREKLNKIKLNKWHIIKISLGVNKCQE